MAYIPLPKVENSRSDPCHNQKADSCSTVPSKLPDSHLLKTEDKANRENGVENGTKEVQSLEAWGFGDIGNIFGRRPRKIKDDYCYDTNWNTLYLRSCQLISRVDLLHPEDPSPSSAAGNYAAKHRPTHSSNSYCGSDHTDNHGQELRR
jgi:hypothetical protein